MSKPTTQHNCLDRERTRRAGVRAHGPGGEYAIRGIFPTVYTPQPGAVKSELA